MPKMDTVVCPHDTPEMLRRIETADGRSSIERELKRDWFVPSNETCDRPMCTVAGTQRDSKVDLEESKTSSFRPRWVPITACVKEMGALMVMPARIC